MVATIRGPEQGGNNGLFREVENITDFPPLDAILADMRFALGDQAAAEDLGRHAAEVLGRATADLFLHKIILPNQALAVIAKRAGHTAHGDYADDLFEIFYSQSWPARRDELTAKARARAEAEIDALLQDRASKSEKMQRLHHIAEDDFGRCSDVVLEEEIPPLVKRAGLGDDEVLTRRILQSGARGRERRHAVRRRAHEVARLDYRCNLNFRKRTGRPLHDLYLINLTTGRAVADEEREAAEIAQVDADIVKTATNTAVGNIERLAGQPLDQLLIEAFVAGFQTRNCEMDVDAMIVEIAAASARLDVEIVAKAIEAGRGSAGGADAEHAFSLFLTREGLVAAVAASAEVEAPSARDEVPKPPTTLSDDEAAERRAVARAVADIKANRDMPIDDLLTIVRQVANEAPSLPANKLSDLLITASRQIPEHVHDAIRFSVDEARRAVEPYDDEAVAVRVDMMLKGVHAPITGQPGLAERNAREVAKANFGGPTVLEWEDPDGLPRRSWLYGFLQRGEFCLTYSLGGVGKTTLWTVEALAIVSGRALLGVAPNEGRGRAWCYSDEEPMHEMKRRIFAACKHYKLGPGDLGGRLFVDNFESCDFVIAEQIREGVSINKPRVDLLVNYLLNNKIDVLFVDPWISTHHVNENDNSAIQQVASAWKEVAVRANVAIHFAHHSRKGSGGNGHDVTQDDARGARSLLDKSRGTRSLGSMSKKEAEDFKIPVEDRRRYFYYDPTEGKPNTALATGKKQWFRTASVMLGAKRNGICDQGESVGVVEKWTPPAPSDSFDKEKIEAIREALGRRRWRTSSQAFRRTDSIYAPVAEVFELDLDSPGDKKQAGAVIKRLCYTKIVVETTEFDEEGRERPYARLPD